MPLPPSGFACSKRKRRRDIEAPSRATSTDTLSRPRSSTMPARLVLALLAIAAAVLAHWGLGRLGHRLPLALARRKGSRAAARSRALRFLAIGLLAAKAAVWAAFLVWLSDQFELLRRTREMFTDSTFLFLSRPVVSLRERSYSPLDLLELPAVFAAAWVAVRLATSLLKRHVLAAAGVERGIQEAVALLARYALLLVASLLILQTWGFDVRSLAVVAGVLGVGVGFGLQNIANNFVSGLIVNLERPVQIGDFIQVGEWTGTVERIGPRCIEIRTLDRVSILVPNARFLETEVVNWSHGDPVTRVHVKIGVAYGSDVGRVRSALLEATRGHPDVLADPRPRVELKGFGESALDFELLVWTRTPRKQEHLKSDLHFRIEATFREHGIEIPFPQCDLNVRSPRIERVVDAWTRRHLPEAVLDEVVRDAAPEAMDATRFDTVGGFDRDALSDLHLASLVARMRGEGGVPQTDRRHWLRVYRGCFVGREAVDWLTMELDLSRDEAVDLGQLLVERGLVHHVLDEHGFEDGNLFYGFTDGAEPSSPGA
jgi:potassium-dependent mechanosensitive channel